MKIRFFSLLITLVVFSNSYQIIFAQTKTATSSSTTATSSAKAVLDKEVINLKEKLAKVTELRKKDQKAYSGTVTKKLNNELVFKTADEQEYTVKIDNALTKFYKISSNSQKEIKQENIEKDSYIIVVGPLIDKLINANSIYIDEQFLIKYGKITEVNKADYYIKVVTSDKDNLTLDIETTTKVTLLNIKSLDMERVGFSKLKEGDTAHFVVKKSEEEKEKNRFPAQKIFVIPQEYFIK